MEARQEAVSAPQITLTAKYIPLVAPFMATKDMRYYLCGINVRPHKDGGVLIAATNGHVLALAYDREGSVDGEYILHIDQRTVAACSGRKPGLKLTLLNGRMTVMSDAEELCVQAGSPFIEGNYPNYSNVVPASDALKPGLVGGFDSAYIAIIDKVVSVARKSGLALRPAVTFFSVGGSPTLPAVARLTGFDDFLAVLMPMRGDPIDQPIPLWVAANAPVDDAASPAPAAAEPAEQAAA